MANAIAGAFGHIGKPYDFEFNFNVSTRIVCTELIYRCYHKKGKIEFPLVKRLGRYTLTGDDIMNLVLESLLKSQQRELEPFRLVSLALKMGDRQAHLIPGAEALESLQKIQAGWRPSKATEAANA